MHRRIIRQYVVAAIMLIVAVGMVSCSKDSKGPTGPGDSTTYTVTGRILESSVGLAGVSINIKGTNVDKSTITDSSGTYTFTDLPGNTYEIAPSLDDYTFEPESRIVTIIEDTVIDDFTATKTGGGVGGRDSHDPPDDLTFVTIPGGTFQMGDVEDGGYEREKPVHTVTVSGFEMDIHEVTNAQYASYLTEALASGDITATSSSVTGASGEWSGQKYIDLDDSDCQISYSGGTFTVDSDMENRPVVEVTWYGSKSFAVYYGLDLPTEAEWEYSCRGGQQLMYGTDDGTLDSTKANYYINALHTTDVGSYPYNPFGLYDMSGNVWEWCHDWYGNYTSDSATNPSGVHSGSYRVIRGGYWYGIASSCRASFRNGTDPASSDYSVGFRVVRRSSPQNY